MSQADVARTAGFNGLIMDGRDIGTVIFPDADLKVFLKADAETRAARRATEGQKDAITARDKQDESRKTAPLQPASDAVIIDNSNITLPEVVEKIVGLLPSM
jgi:CMP/dCMP kinase